MPEKEWVEPKTNYVAGDQVTPTIFNNLGENAKYLYEIRCNMELKPLEGETVTVNAIVFEEQ